MGDSIVTTPTAQPSFSVTLVMLHYNVCYLAFTRWAILIIFSDTRDVFSVRYGFLPSYKSILFIIPIAVPTYNAELCTGFSIAIMGDNGTYESQDWLEAEADCGADEFAESEFVQEFRRRRRKQRG